MKQIIIFTDDTYGGINLMREANEFLSKNKDVAELVDVKFPSNETICLIINTEKHFDVDIIDTSDDKFECNIF